MHCSRWLIAILMINNWKNARNDRVLYVFCSFLALKRRDFGPKKWVETAPLLTMK